MVQAQATAKYLRGSPQKAKLVVDLIRGRRAAEALSILPRASGLKSGVKREKIDIFTDIINDLDDAFDHPRFVAQAADHSGNTMHLLLDFHELLLGEIQALFSLLGKIARVSNIAGYIRRSPGYLS